MVKLGSPIEGLPLEDNPLNGSANTIHLNIIYTSLTLASFFLSVPALLLTVATYRTISSVATATARHTEQLFVLASVVVSLVTFFDSFQWAYLLGPHGTGCKVVGALHQYATAMLLVFGACFGVYLVIMTRRLKCFMVIDEEKRRRYCWFVLGFTLAILIVPLLFVLGPISTNSYGPYDYKCWLATNYSYTASQPSGVVSPLEEALFVHVWGILVSAFVIVAILIAYITLYCRASRLTRHVLVVAIGMIGFPIITALNLTVYVFITVRHAERIEPLLYVTAIWTPLQFIVADTALVLRSCIIVNCRRRQYTPIQDFREPPADEDAQNVATVRVLPQCSTGDDTSEG